MCKEYLLPFTGAAMDTDFILELVGFAALEGIIMGAILGIIWSMAAKTLQLFLLVQFILFKWLESRNIITVDWERLTMGLLNEGGAAVNEAITILESLLDTGVFTVNVAIGFFLVRKFKS